MKNLIAEIPHPGSGGTITNPVLDSNIQSLSGVEYFQRLVPAAVGLGFVIGVIIFFFVMLMGAIQWIASGGDKAAVEAARGKIINAVVGIIILFSIFGIIALIQGFFKVSILTLDIGPLKIR